MKVRLAAPVAAHATAVIAALLVAQTARAQGAPQLPPPPPPTSPPTYTTPSPAQGTPRAAPQPTPSPRPRREPDRDPPKGPPDPAPQRIHYPPPTLERGERDRDRDDAPPAHTGFQLALRLGIAAPFGGVTAANNDSLSNLSKTQVPFLVEVGAKITPAIYLGGYAGLAFGGAGQAFHDGQGCTTAARGCLASSFRIGVEAQYHFQPAERMNPWVGYGIGYESTGAAASGGGPEVTRTVSGIEFLRLSGGLDFRLSRVFGIGPALDLSLGEYGHSHVEGVGTVDQSITNGTLHGWLTLGVRGVFFP